MPYIVKMTYTYPENKPFPPERDMRFPIPEEVKQLKDTFVQQGKILSIDGHFSPDVFTGTTITVFNSQEAFNEWCANPTIVDFFRQRDEFLTLKEIGKSTEITTA
jgi:hypothetical protein